MNNKKIYEAIEQLENCNYGLVKKILLEMLEDQIKYDNNISNDKK